ncbi:MAG: hypothetical protein WC308_03185 [archaeon]|jgi:hypothetical protein
MKNKYINRRQPKPEKSLIAAAYAVAPKPKSGGGLIRFLKTKKRELSMAKIDMSGRDPRMVKWMDSEIKKIDSTLKRLNRK